MPEPIVSMAAEDDEAGGRAAGSGAAGSAPTGAGSAGPGAASGGSGGALASGADASASATFPADDALGPTVILPARQPRQVVAAEPGIACWFGKLPFLGDFASRRLPESFIRPWDEWLQPGLAAARDAIGDPWLDLYLTFPVWRFVLPAGLLGDTCWIGVLLPSVDRVGRCFPLTICEPLARSTLEDAGLIGIDLHLAALAGAGIEALDADAVDFLEQRLAGLGTLRTCSDAWAGAGTTGTAATAAAAPIPLEAWLQRPRPGQEPVSAAWRLSATVPAVLASAASRFVVATLRDRALWWSPADESGGCGALLLEPFPFSSRLLGRLIGSN